MICQNCGKNEANVKYTQIINGVKKQMSLCNNCAEELGLENIGFDMPIDFSSFLGDMFEDEHTSFIPDLINLKSLTCDKCNMTYDDFTEVGKFGCEDCYESFENKIEQLIKSIQGSNRHVGRLDKKTIESNKSNINKKESNIETEKRSIDKVQKNENDIESKIEKLQKKLKKEIKEERYEDAAKTRDEIKKLQGK